MTITGADQGCAKTVAELSDYLARDRIPYDPAIEDSPECVNALQALQRISQLSRDLLDEDARTLPPPPPSWFDSIMTSIRSEIRSGRDFPLRHPDPRVTLTVTEGAVRSLLRAAGDAVPGVIVGSCRIVGPAELPGAAVRVAVSASVAWRVRIPVVVPRLREAIGRALADHTELNVTAIDIHIEQLHGID